MNREHSFGTLHHICIVVHNIDRSAAYFQSLGLGPWQDFPPLTDFETLRVPNQPAFLAMKYKALDLGNVQLQLCEPPEMDCPQRRFLDTRGEGVFHLGFEANLDVAAANAAAAGLTQLMHGVRADGTGFTYFDTQAETGVVLMNRQSVPTS
jgi:methylmalonyl-CoA/ethylmalonyl-CoA epimerase